MANHPITDSIKTGQYQKIREQVASERHYDGRRAPEFRLGRRCPTRNVVRTTHVGPPTRPLARTFGVAESNMMGDSWRKSE
jgi:hypothetical protein